MRAPFPQRRVLDIVIHYWATYFCLMYLDKAPISLTICYLGNVVCIFIYLFGPERIAAWWVRNIVAEGPADE